MIGLNGPLDYDPEAWRAYIDALRAHPDYPWRADDIASAEAKLRVIEKSIEETGKPPTAMQMLEHVIPHMNLPLEKRAIQGDESL